MASKRGWQPQYEICERAVLYEARGAILHPTLEETYTETLNHLANQRRLCLTPLTQLQQYSQRMRKVA